MDSRRSRTGIGALFAPQPGQEETQMQGLYQDLLACLSGNVEAQRQPMTGFAQILTFITDVVTEKQNEQLPTTPTRCPLPQSAKSHIERIEDHSSNPQMNIQQPQPQSSTVPMNKEIRNLTVSQEDQMKTMCQQVYASATAHFQEGLPEAESELVVIHAVKSVEEDDEDEENENNFPFAEFEEDKKRIMNEGGDLGTYQQDISAEVMSAMKKFGLQELVPRPEVGPWTQPSLPEDENRYERWGKSVAEMSFVGGSQDLAAASLRSIGATSESFEIDQLDIEEPNDDKPAGSNRWFSRFMTGDNCQDQTPLTILGNYMTSGSHLPADKSRGDIGDNSPTYNS